MHLGFLMVKSQDAATGKHLKIVAKMVVIKRAIVSAPVTYISRRKPWYGKIRRYETMMESFVKVTARAEKMCMTNMSYFRVSMLCDAMGYLWCARTCITSVNCSNRWIRSLPRFQKCWPNPYLSADNMGKSVQGLGSTQVIE